MKNNFWFGVTLTLSLMFMAFCFQYAYFERGYLAYGGEVFTIVLPLMIVGLKISREEQKIRQLKKQNKKLEMLLWRDLQSQHIAPAMNVQNNGGDKQVQELLPPKDEQ